MSDIKPFTGIQWNKIIELAVKQVGKPAVYASCGEIETDENKLIFNTFKESVHSNYPNNIAFELITATLNSDVIFFDTIEEQYKFYRLFETEITYSSILYACTFNKDGYCETENT